MIYVLTIHYKSSQWIPIQTSYLKQNLKHYQVYSYIDGIEIDLDDINFTFTGQSSIEIDGSKGHAKKLDQLVSEIKDASDDDIILFLDGDSFPIAPLNKFIENWISKYDFVSIVRKEMNHTFPHPSFAFCKFGTWRNQGLTWKVKFDTGGVLKDQVEEKNLKWKKLYRTKSMGIHPVMFGVYADLVYHHTAGFRSAVTRWDKDNQKFNSQEREREALTILEKIKSKKIKFL